MNKLFQNGRSPNAPTKIRYFFLCAAGAALAAAFAPVDIKIFSLLAPAYLLYDWLTQNDRLALSGFCFGLGFFGLGTSWLYVSIHYFGHTPIPLALFLTSIFVAGMSLLFAFQGYLFAKTRSFTKNSRALFFFPLLWVLQEWIRSHIFTGFPWLLLAHAQLDTPLAALAPIMGDLGLAAVTVFIAALLTLSALQQKYFHKISATFFCLMLGLSHYFFALPLHHWTTSTHHTLRVGLVQSDIEQAIKWDENALTKIIEVHQSLSEPLMTKHDVVIWPEAALPALESSLSDLLTRLDFNYAKANSTLITGIVLEDNQGLLYNGMLALGKHSGGRYAKHHLVPFGEYVPFDHYLRGLIAFFDIPMSDLSSGPLKQKGFSINETTLAPFICYEIAYENTLRDNLFDHQALLVISNDAWFGRSFAAAQHLQIARFRALQSGRDLIMVGNNGYTALINDLGQITQAIPPYRRGILEGQIEGRTGLTPWAKMAIDVDRWSE